MIPVKRFDYKHAHMIAGHRGDRACCPENTMASFRSAVEKGVDMLETDIHMTRDGVLYLMHNHTVDNTTDGTGAVREKTAREMDALRSRGEKIPTLEELLIYAQGNDVLLNLELKDWYDVVGEAFARESIQKSYDMVEKYGLLDRVVFNSFDAWTLEYLADRYDCRLHGFYPYSHLSTVRRNPDEYPHRACSYDEFNPDAYAYLADRGIECWIGPSMKNREQYRQTMELGAVLYTVDDPGDAIAQLDALRAR